MPRKKRQSLANSVSTANRAPAATTAPVDSDTSSGSDDGSAVMRATADDASVLERINPLRRLRQGVSGDADSSSAASAPARAPTNSKSPSGALAGATAGASARLVPSLTAFKPLTGASSARLRGTGVTGAAASMQSLSLPGQFRMRAPSSDEYRSRPVCSLSTVSYYSVSLRVPCPLPAGLFGYAGTSADADDTSSGASDLLGERMCRHLIT